MRKIYSVLTLVIIGFVFCHCNQPADGNKRIPKKRIAPKSVGYHFEKYGKWIKKKTSDTQYQIILAVNRTDKDNLARMDSIVVPDDAAGDIENYLPFPINVASIQDIPKIIFFSYPSQTFGAYEMGELIYTGPVNMGRQKDPTPTGLFYTNWKAEKTTSTFNDEWDLRWNVNIENKQGIGWHQYNMPGYPASHSCLRLLENDANKLYAWADEWIVGDNDSVKAQGTPVVVFGSYAFDAPKPWLQLVANPHAMDIAPEAIEQQVAGFLGDIRMQQKRRAMVVSNK